MSDDTPGPATVLTAPADERSTAYTVEINRPLFGGGHTVHTQEITATFGASEYWTPAAARVFAAQLLARADEAEAADRELAEGNAWLAEHLPTWPTARPAA